jgi:predicted SnoaL-like aldol condensation-catalyzing enzyme
MSEENRAVVQRLIDDVINARNVDALSEVYAEDCVIHGHPYVGMGFIPDFAVSDRFIIYQTIPGTPAAEKLLPDDEIVRAEDAFGVTEGSENLWMLSWGHGEVDSDLTLLVKRNGKLLNVELTRALIQSDVGSEQMREAFERSAEKWPNLTVTPELIISAGDLVVCYWRASGTHARYNRSATWVETEIFRIRNGKIVEEWFVADTESMLKQLGFRINAPEPALTPG